MSVAQRSISGPDGGEKVHSRVKALGRENAELRAALRDKEIELRECNHRIANGLQIAASLMRMQIKAVRDEISKDILQIAASRIEALGRFHRHLTVADSELKVDFGEYLGTAAKEISASSGLHCDVRSGKHLFVDSHVAMNLAIIINELVVNAKKHAYADKPGGRLEITSFANDENYLQLNVTDYGPGLPSDFDLDKSTGMGLWVVRSIAKELRAKIVTENNHGACFKVTIPTGVGEAINR